MAKFRGTVNLGQGIAGLASAGRIQGDSLRLLQRGIENLGGGIQSIGQGVANKRNRGIAQAERDRVFASNEGQRQFSRSLGIAQEYRFGIEQSQNQLDDVNEQIESKRQEAQGVSDPEGRQAIAQDLQPLMQEQQRLTRGIQEAGAKVKVLRESMRRSLVRKPDG